ncbi:phosphotransferase [Actinoplanes sp. NPDC089786]|uniref:phosphotransferase family protein n=1 Tax=Actinoplanes sp. NPDC089786 TaxID=3155185 RepID=UPI00342198F6
MGRTVKLVLLDTLGVPLGALPPFDVSVPWWPEVEEVVAGARSRYGIEVQVLRLLTASGATAATGGGTVTYLAQLAGSPPIAVEPADPDLSPQPCRAPYAEPGGPAASIRWAIAALDALGSPNAVATQRKTWNLSAIWRLDVAGAPVAWLKQVPEFFAHEPAVLGLVAGVAPGLVPPLLAAGSQGRMLLAHVPGEDGFGAGAGVRAEIAAEWHPVQEHFADRVDDLLAVGLPDARLAVEPFARVAAGHRADVDGLGEVIDELPRRLERIAACRLPDTIVHGDLHPGNARIRSGAPAVIMDWGDASVGHPADDILRLTEGLPGTEAEALTVAWALRWRAARPDSDPQLAAELMRPVFHLRRAVIYADFVAKIEPAEHPYHAADVREGLTAAVAAVR